MRKIITEEFFDVMTVNGENFFRVRGNDTYSLNTETGIYMFEVEYHIEKVTCKVSFVVFSIESWLPCLDVFITDFVL